MTDKTPNYSDAQVALIVAAIAANGNVANMTVAETLAANPEMNATIDGKSEPRKPRSIVAKMRRVCDDTEGFTYERKVATTKTGGVPTKKSELVERIATLSGIAASKLTGLDNAPKLALETLAADYAARNAA